MIHSKHQNQSNVFSCQLTNPSIHEAARTLADTAAQHRVSWLAASTTRAAIRAFAISPLMSAVECKSGCAMQQQLPKCYKNTLRDAAATAARRSGVHGWFAGQKGWQLKLGFSSGY
jgi:hypothetical protein